MQKGIRMKGIVICELLNVRSTPEIREDNVTMIATYGTELNIISDEILWLEVEVNGSTGYVMAEFVEHDAQGGGTGGGVQADWNQNNEEAADYVKNRTHYEETERTAIVERDVILSGQLLYKETSDPVPSDAFVIGDTYIVTLDGVEYEDVMTADAELNDKSYLFGPWEEYSVCPVNIVAQGGSVWVNFEDWMSNTPHQLKIEHVTSKVKPLDEKFIRFASPNGTQYKITVSDDGTLTATAV